MTAVLVGIAALVGAPMRLLVDRYVAHFSGRPLMWGTLAVNVVGSFVLGLVTAGGSSGTRTVIGIGFAGSFTTFSTFAFETLHLFETGQRRLAWTNVVLSLSLGLAAVALGWGLAAR